MLHRSCDHYMIKHWKLLKSCDHDDQPFGCNSDHVTIRWSNIGCHSDHVTIMTNHLEATQIMWPLDDQTWDVTQIMWLWWWTIWKPLRSYDNWMTKHLEATQIMWPLDDQTFECHSDHVTIRWSNIGSHSDRVTIGWPNIWMTLRSCDH